MRLVAASAVALSLVGWGYLHPPFRPDAHLVSPAVRKELVRTGFKATQGVSTVTFESIESESGYSDKWTARQEIVPIDALLTEKRTRRETRGLTQEASGLYVGPFAVVQFRRNWPPLIGDLLPYNFWTSSRMTEFVVEHVDNFPLAKGGKLLARASYEDGYADGGLASTERIRLRCDVRESRDATSIGAQLSGTAVRIECVETPEESPSDASSSIRYAHWYITNRGWSIPADGQYPVTAGEYVAIRKWRSTLTSYDPSP